MSHMGGARNLQVDRGRGGIPLLPIKFMFGDAKNRGDPVEAQSLGLCAARFRLTDPCQSLHDAQRQFITGFRSPGAI